LLSHGIFVAWVEEVRVAKSNRKGNIASLTILKPSQTTSAGSTSTCVPSSIPVMIRDHYFIYIVVLFLLSSDDDDSKRTVKKVTVQKNSPC